MIIDNYITILGSISNSDYQMNGPFAADDNNWSILAMKFDFGMKDSNCFTNIAISTVVLSITWVKDLTYITERHSSITSDILTNNGIATKMRALQYETDYFRFPYCSLPGSTPHLFD